MREQTRLLLIAGLIVGTGCYDTVEIPKDAASEPSGWANTFEESTPDNKATVYEDTTVEEPDYGPSSQIMTCGAEQTWLSNDYRYWLDALFFEFSPNDGLLLRSDNMFGMGAMFATDDGEIMSPSAGSVASLDATWHAGVRFSNYEDLELVSAITGDILHSAPRPEDGQWVAAAIRHDQGAVVGVTCNSFEALYLSYFNGDLALTDHVLLAGEKCATYGNRPKVLFTQDKKRVVVASTDGALQVYDVATGEVTYKVVHGDPTDDDLGLRYQTRLLEAKLVPGDLQVVTTGLDGRLVVTRLDDLSEVTSWPVAVGLINEMTYAPPIAVSPVALSDDGHLIAFVAPDESIRVNDGESELRFEIPEVESEWEPGRTFAAAVLAFSHDGNQLAVGTEFGAVMYGCGVERPRSEGSLPIVLQGPQEVQVGETVEFEATHAGLPEFHAHRFSVDGQFQGHASGDRAFTFYANEPGVYDIVVEVDNGVATGIASTQLRVVTSEP